MNIAPIVVAATVGAILLVLTKCISLDEAYQSIDWTIIFLLAGVLSLGTALENTGAAKLISTQLVSTVGTLLAVRIVRAVLCVRAVLAVRGVRDMFHGVERFLHIFPVSGVTSVVYAIQRSKAFQQRSNGSWNA